MKCQYAGETARKKKGLAIAEMRNQIIAELAIGRCDARDVGSDDEAKKKR